MVTKIERLQVGMAEPKSLEIAGILTRCTVHAISFQVSTLSINIFATLVSILLKHLALHHLYLF